MHLNEPSLMSLRSKIEKNLSKILCPPRAVVLDLITFLPEITFDKIDEIYNPGLKIPCLTTPHPCSHPPCLC